jgi:sugar lactone lactonase YvrE
VTISNGLAWTVDSSFAYYNDTPTGRIDVFDSDLTGELANRRPFVTIDSESGAPDGLTVDAHGGVWTALWGGGAVHHYAPSGVLEDVIEVPARNVTACTFGGEILDELYITTSREAADPADRNAGALFRYLPGVRGVAALQFAG